MSGTKVVFDTNALILFFKGLASLEKYTTADIVVSIVTVIEFLSYPNITYLEEQFLESFVQDATVVGLDIDDLELMNKIIELRKTYRIKLPDAIIAATAMKTKSSLLTMDNHFSKIDGLTTLSFD